MSHGLAAGILGNHLGGIGRALTGSLEAHLAGAGPADYGSAKVGDADNGIVEGRLHMGDAMRDVLASLGLDNLGRLNRIIEIKAHGSCRSGLLGFFLLVLFGLGLLGFFNRRCGWSHGIGSGRCCCFSNYGMMLLVLFVALGVLGEAFGTGTGSLGCGCFFGHEWKMLNRCDTVYAINPWNGRHRLFYEAPCGCGHWSGCADHEREVPDGGEVHDSS